MTCDNGDVVPASPLAIIDVPAGTQHAPGEGMTCIIIRQGAFQEYGRLHAALGDLVPIIWDRRRGHSREQPVCSALIQTFS